MSSRTSPLHPVFASYWVLWCLSLIINLYLFPINIWVDLILLIGFLVPEGIALAVKKMTVWNGNKVSLRDTLSQFQTYIAKMAKPESRWYQSWNALVVYFALHPAWAVARYTPELLFGFFPFQLVTFGLLVGWLVFHWLRPSKHG